MELQKRLDDASNAVRIAACSTLSVHAPDLNTDEAEVLVKGILVHMDDDEGSVREAVCTVMLKLTASHSELLRTVVPAITAKHRHQGCVHRLLNAC